MSTNVTELDEESRLEALKSYDILDTPSDGTFDSITALVAQWLDVPIAIVSLVDRDRIWFKSHHGTDTSQVAREPGLCASAIMSNSPYIVSDAKLDPRALTNPLVAGDFGLRAYAAVPLETRDHHNLGTLCVLDFKPRSFSSKDINTMRTLATVVMDQMELRLSVRKIDILHRRLQVMHERLREESSLDSLTGIMNRGALSEGLKTIMLEAQRAHHGMAVMMFDVDQFKSINDTHGHAVGDEVLVEVARRLQRAVRGKDLLGRFGGEEFLIAVSPCDVELGIRVAERCRKMVSDEPFVVGPAQSLSLKVTISGGLRMVQDVKPEQLADVLASADEALYEAKHLGRNQISVRSVD